jgi:hypothetical protein
MEKMKQKSEPQEYVKNGSAGMNKQKNLTWKPSFEGEFSEIEKHINRFILLLSVITAKTTAKERKDVYDRPRPFADFVSTLQGIKILIKTFCSNNKLLINQNPFLEVASALWEDGGCNIKLSKEDKQLIIDKFNTYADVPKGRKGLFAYAMVWAGGLFLAFMSFVWIAVGKRFFTSSVCLIWFAALIVTALGVFWELVIHGKIKNVHIRLFFMVSTDDCMYALEDEMAEIMKLFSFIK